VKYFLIYLALAGLASAGVVTPDLANIMSTSRSDELLPVFIRVNGELDAAYIDAATVGMSMDARRAFAVEVLQNLAVETQTPVLEVLKSYPEELVTGVNVDWLVNVISCETTVEVIREMASRDDVQFVSFRYAMSPMIEDMDDAIPVEGSTDANTWGVDKINAPAVWAMGYNGTGIIVADIDTGCYYLHVDLQSHMWHDTPAGLHYGWDMENNDGDPMDNNGHGTHTMGTIGSDGTAGTQAGVAPEATLMAIRVMTSVSPAAEQNVIDGFQWAINHGADILSTSLGYMYSWSPQRALWRTAEQNMLTVGVHHAVAAGNEGPTAPSIRTPGDCPPPWRHTPEQVATGAFAAVTTVGATDSGDAIASFSSRGPVTWETIAPWNDWNDTPPNAGLIDPDVCAPGVGVVSCAMSVGGYTSMDGTSMATPHVAGSMALILDANPNITCSQMNQILEETAVDLGAAGKENIFGAGRINCLAAVNAAIAVGIEQGAGTVPAPGLLVSAVTPNPASSVAYFDLYTGDAARVVVTVYDISGRNVALVSSGDMGSGSHTMSFAIPDGMSNGIYLIRATAGSQSATSRLTVLR